MRTKKKRRERRNKGDRHLREGAAERINDTRAKGRLEKRPTKDPIGVGGWGCGWESKMLNTDIKIERKRKNLDT